MVFTFIDLFSGIGGLRLAFDKFDGQCVFSSEIDKFCRLTYKENFNETPAGDINLINLNGIPKHDILLAGFPCQPFSFAGVIKRISLDRAHGFKCQEKGILFFKIVEVLRLHQPKAFLLENVKYLRSHNKGETIKTIKKLLELSGYTVYDRVVDARLLVPQHRERIFIIGIRQDLNVDFNIDDIKIPTENPPLKNILESNVGNEYTLSDRLWKWLQDHKEKHKRKGNGFGYSLADIDGYSRTLSARYYKDGSEILIPQENKNPRKLTPRECARLMGFPDTFKIPVSNTQAYKQFGNSVVVPIVELFAESMVECLFNNNILSPPASLPEGSEKSSESCLAGEGTTSMTSLGEAPLIDTTL